MYRRRTGKVEFNRADNLFYPSSNQSTALRTLSNPVDVDETGTNGISTSFMPLQNEPVDDEEDPKKKLMEEDMKFLEAEKSKPSPFSHTVPITTFFFMI